MIALIQKVGANRDQRKKKQDLNILLVDIKLVYYLTMVV